MVRRSIRKPEFTIRRGLLEEAANVLRHVSSGAAWRDTYAKSTPALNVKNNVFYFDRRTGVRRAVLWGYSVFFDAPGLEELGISGLVRKYPEEVRKRLHHGRLNCYLDIVSSKSIEVLRKICTELKANARVVR